MQKTMIDICEYSQCTGCMACLNSCSHSAINIEFDDEGFERPHINQDLCVDCG